MPRVIDALRQEHANMAKLLDALERQLAIFERGDVPDYDIIRGIVDYSLSYPDFYHHPKEDRVFRKLQARDPRAAEAVGDLLAEHEELAALTHKFATVVENVLQEAEIPRESFERLARTFIERSRHHMEHEDTVFFPAAGKALTPQDWSDIEAQLVGREDPLFGPATEERFETLSHDILAWDRAQQED